jgi:2'-hydroxyisoflavone reductase
MNRRQFVSRSLSCCALPFLQAPVLAQIVPAKPKSILVLGGTYYLGPAIVSAALADGHKVTLFNRGITNPQLFPLVPKLRGLRSLDPKQQNLAALANGRWDAIVDVWPSEPSLASTAAELLQDKTDHYLYVSSIAAYDRANYARSGTTEDAKLRSYGGDETQYGPGKAESERRLETIVGKRLTIVRPGPIEGSGNDCTGGGLLLTWLARAQSGGRHIGPGDGFDPIQFVDVKDVGRFLVKAINERLYGSFNLVETFRTFRDHIDCCKAATHSNAEFVWIPRDFLEANGLPPAGEDGKPDYFRGWRPDETRKGLFEMSNAKALSVGWQTRPFSDSALDTLAPCRVRANGVFDFRDPLPAEKEAAVIDAWLRHSSKVAS